MNFLRRFKRKEPTLDDAKTEATRKLYYTKEYNTVAPKDGSINYKEFRRLMELLLLKGGPGQKCDTESLKWWKGEGKTKDSQMTLDEYLKMMAKYYCNSQTNCWRELFYEFDLKDDGLASKQDVLLRLEKGLGVTCNDKAQFTVYEMNANLDQKISYGDFLSQLLNYYTIAGGKNIVFCVNG